jgi:DNA-binding transcriptional MerR regulator
MINQEKYSIGSAAKKIDVESHTVRFWTNEFSDDIECVIGNGGRRYYTEESIKTLQKIKDLIHIKGIKIRTIKDQNLLHTPFGKVDVDLLDKIKVIRDDLTKIANSLA